MQKKTLSNTPFYTDYRNGMVFSENKLYYAEQYVAATKEGYIKYHYLFKCIKVNRKSVRFLVVGKYESTQDSVKYGSKFKCDLYDFGDDYIMEAKLVNSEDYGYSSSYMVAKHNKLIITPLKGIVRGWWEFIENSEN